MEEPTAKGTVAPLSSMFAVDDVQKAARHVQDVLSEKQQELDRIKEFIADNTNLINLSQKLPEELHQDIMCTGLTMQAVLEGYGLLIKSVDGDVADGVLPMADGVLLLEDCIAYG